jgi:hypothetical protein
MSNEYRIKPIIERLVKDVSTERLIECMKTEETQDQELMDLVYEELRLRGVFLTEGFDK